MITVHWYGETFSADKAVQVDNSIILYDENNQELERIINIRMQDWDHIEVDGRLIDPSEIPTEEERLRADLDFVTMENEYLNEVNEQQQADIDYCLMLLEE